jgi:hypothetical protein
MSQLRSSALVRLSLFALLLLLIAGLSGCSSTSLNGVTTTNNQTGAADSGVIPLGSGASAPQDISACDFNADGKMDLLTVNGGSNNLSVFLGKGDGTFNSPTTVSLPANAVAPVQAVCADFNGDGKLDLAVTFPQSQSVLILLGNGDGTFAAGPSFSTGANTAPYYISTGDLNNDGKADLLVGNQSGLNQVEVMLGNGDGTFTAATPLQIVEGVNIAIADFNGDGKMDIAYGDPSGGMRIRLGNGDGTFGPVDAMGLRAGTYVVAYDINGDGKMDVVGSGGLILLGNGDGTFNQLNASGVGGDVVAVGNFHGTVITQTVNNQPVQFKIADIAAITTAYPLMTVYAGVGDGTFTTPGTAYAAGDHPRAIAAGDFNGDGKTDFAVVSSADNTIGIILGK